MKKITTYLIITILSFICNPLHSEAIELKSESITVPHEEQHANVDKLNARLIEIRDMDKSKMTHSEKRILRKEVKSIDKQLKTANNGGVYISVGAVIIIVLLLIILL